VVDRAVIQHAVSSVMEPDLRRTLGDLGLVRRLEQKGGEVQVEVAVPGPEWPADALRKRLALATSGIADLSGVNFSLVPLDAGEQEVLAAQLRAGLPERPGGQGSRTRVIGIASGKGGVGKSSVAVNTAVALARAGHDVAILDADVWGYSIPRMLGVERPPSAVDGLLIPPAAHGVRVISMDFFVGPDQAVLWRGPMLHKALEQFLDEVFWDEPEFLLLDLPPGTGDVAISLSQFIPAAQTIIVTTPQSTAHRVARRAALMSGKVSQEVLGVVENMSWFTGDDGKRYEIFGAGGGRSLAEDLGVPLLGQVPLVPELRAGADRGEPAMVAVPESEAAAAFDAIASRLVESRPRVRRPRELVIE
jgi:ATP-binding protein involved in chromosome partitioning